MKQVTIIMPAYNADKTIESTIKSILNQNYQKENYELIIVNDHSSDNTEEILKKYSEKYPQNIKYFNNLKEKKGVSSARNLALTKCNSKYVMFIDADDCYNENMITTMVNTMEQCNTDMVVCGYKRILVEKNRERLLYLEEQEAKEIKEIKVLLEKLQNVGLFNQLWNKIFKLDRIKENNLEFLENISIGEDYRFILEYTINCTKIKNINEILYDYYSNSQGLNLKHYEEKLIVKLDNINFHKKMYEKYNLDTYYIDKLYVLTFLSGISNVVEHNTKEIAKEQIKKCNDNLEIKSNLQRIYDNVKNIKIRLLIRFLLKTKHLYLFGKIMKILKHIYRRVKFE